MRIIDTHAHVFPAKIGQAATEAIGEFYESPMAHVGSSEELIKAGRKAGVTDYVIFSTATTPRQVAKINDFILGECKKHPEFIGVGTIHPGLEDSEKELDRIYDLGMRGIKLHPDFQKIDINADEFMGIYDYMEKKNMFLITHSGDPRHKYSQPAKVASVAKLFPKMNIVAAHFGGWMSWEEARRELNLPNVYMDTSSTFGFEGRNAAIAALDHFDPSHIFFGVDFPMWDHESEIENIKGLNLPNDMFEMIMYKNFENFYKMYS